MVGEKKHSRLSRDAAQPHIKGGNPVRRICKVNPLYGFRSSKFCLRQNINGMTVMLFILLLLSLCISSPAHAQNCGTPTTSGLVGYWTLDESSGTTAADSSGNGNTGTMYNGMNATDDSVAGIIDGALYWSDVDDHYLRVESSATIDDIFAGGGTITGWIYPIDNTFGANTLAYKTTNPGTLPEGFDFKVREANRDIQFRQAFSGGRQEFNSVNDVITYNQWNHIAVVYDRDDVNNTPIFYVNGQEVGYQGAGTIGTPVNPADSDTAVRFLIGRSDSSEYIDDVRVYNRALSSEEIAQIYKFGLGDEGAMIFNQDNASLEYCDGTDWRMAGLGGYNPNAVAFDGANDSLARNDDLTGITDTKIWSGYGWFKRNSIGANTLYTATSSAAKIRFTSLDVFEVSATDSASTEILRCRSNTAYTDNNWHSFMFSFDLSDSDKQHLYIDGVDVLGASCSIYTNDIINASTSNHQIGANSGGSDNWFNGALTDFWIDFGTYIDLSAEENRRKFLSESGMPMYLGADGSIPTGNAPDIFLSGDTENWHVNKGTGGGFTENGEITYSSSRPGDIILADNIVSSNLVNSVSVEGAAAGTSYTLNFGYTATTGNLLVVAGAWDKDVTGITVTSPGWTQIAVDGDGGSTTGGMWYKVSDGTETSVAFSWTNSEEVSLWTGEYSGIVSTSPFDQSSSNNSGGTSVTSISTGTTPALSSSGQFAIAMVGVDSGNDLNSGGSWSNGFDAVTYLCASCDYGGDPGLGIATKMISGTSGVETTYSSSDVGDQAMAILATFVGDEGVARPGQVRYNGNFNVMEYYNGVDWVAMGPVGGTPPTDGLVAHYELDESAGTTAADSSGNGNNGTLINGMDATNWNPSGGQLGGSVTFDAAANEAIDTGFTSVDTNQAFTYAGWLKTPGGDFAAVMAQEWDTSSVDLSPMIEVRNDYLRALDGIGDGDNTLFDTPPIITPNKWHHFVFVYSGGSDVYWYINGELVASDSSGEWNPWNDTTTNLYLGAYMNSGDIDSELNGELDDVRIYNRALTAQEAQQLYYFGTSGGLGDVDNSCADAGPITGADAEGQIFYNIDNNVMQYCNGEEWIGIGQ